ANLRSQNATSSLEVREKQGETTNLKSQFVISSLQVLDNQGVTADRSQIVTGSPKLLRRTRGQNCDATA
ncbi:MAG: hypothetical protein AAB353_13530, partial [Candidatus Hydrogenedentota bacterium]